MAVTPETARHCLAENFADWVQALDLTVERIGPEGAVLTMPIAPKLARVGGILSGQALAAMADTSMVFACAGYLGEFMPVATTNLDTVFLRPGTGTSVRCEAEVVRAGKPAFVFDFSAVVDGEAPDLMLQPGDRVFVPESPL